MRNGLAVAGSYFKKRESHKITYRSGQHQSEIDLVVVRRQHLARIKDCKVIAGEHVTTQHKPVIWEVRIQWKRRNNATGRKVLRWWKCKEDVAEEYKRRVTEKFESLSVRVGDLEEEWENFKDGLVGTAEELCGRTSGKKRSRKNQEWWTEDVARAIKEKKETWKAVEEIRKEGGQPSQQLKHQYGQKKNAAKKAVAMARRKLEDNLYNQLEQDQGQRLVYKLAKDRDEDAKDIRGGAVMKDNNGSLVTESKEVLKLWRSYFSELLNQGDGNVDITCPSSVREEWVINRITYREVRLALRKMKVGKSPGFDEVQAEMIKLMGEVGIKWTARLLNKCMEEGQIPKEWRVGIIIPIWKKKGDVQDPGKYRGITLLSHVMKLLERILDHRIRVRVEPHIGEEQQGFRQGRGTIDGIFSIRQLTEKKLERQSSMVVAFVDLEKAYDTVPRELVFATLRWMGVSECDVSMVEGLYQDTGAMVRTEGGISETFPVNIGLRQGSALSPLLFIIVMELVSRKRGGDVLEKVLYADDLSLTAESGEELEKQLGEWTMEFERHGLRVSQEKTEVMWIGEQSVDLDIKLKGRRLRQVSSFAYLGSTITEDGKTGREVCKRLQAGANAWRKVEGVMRDKKISKKIKGKILTTCVVPACVYGLEAVALTDEQLKKLQVCENNWVRRIVGAKRTDRRRMEDLRKEIGLKRTLADTVRRNRLRWAGQVANMDEGRMPKRAFQQVMQGRRRRGRPRLRWTDCVKKDLQHTGEMEEWTRVAMDQRRWRNIVRTL